MTHISCIAFKQAKWSERIKNQNLFRNTVFNSFTYIFVADSSLEPSDPRFIGAWWLGFLVIAAILLLFSLPLFVFPASLLPIEEDQTENVENHTTHFYGATGKSSNPQNDSPEQSNQRKGFKQTARGKGFYSNTRFVTIIYLHSGYSRKVDYCLRQLTLGAGQENCWPKI